jgi:oxygen-independent coproporphyrinogen-3 oxidase
MIYMKHIKMQYVSKLTTFVVTTAMAGLYIHIPFCSSKCPYCNFFSSASTRHRDGFAALLAEEMSLRASYLDGHELQTIYFGGGTPSLMSPSDLRMMIVKAKELFASPPLQEITVEANPEHVNTAWLQGIMDAGVTRISLGIQSLHDEVLNELGRNHDAAQAREAIQRCIESQIPEISVDLIFGMDSLTDEMLVSDLEWLCQPRIGHLSAYALTVEESTALARLISKGQRKPVDEEKLVRQMNLVMETLTQRGFEQYEISNYCKAGKQSKHNSSYWNGTSYLGIGPSAHSYNGTSRSWNVSRIEDYIRSVRAGEPAMETETLSKVQRYNEYIMTSVRTSGGIEKEWVHKEFGDDLLQLLMDQARDSLQKDLLKDQHGCLSLTNAGKLLADGITASLFAEE